MIGIFLALHAGVSHALPTSGSNGPQIPITDPTGQVALLWTSIGLAVATSFCQGLIVAIVAIAEDQGMWTFRFRIARYEHLWWTVVSTMLASSFIFIGINFLAGNSSNSLDVLTLSTATSISVVRYAIPAWRNRSYIELRWRSWTGPSRTGISSIYAQFCGTKLDWKRVQRISHHRPIVPTPSDEWGWAIMRPTGISQDPTALLQGLDEKTLRDETRTNTLLGPCLYDDGFRGHQVSLLWGEKEGFQLRVSRAVNSMPSSLLKSNPSTYDGFNGTGLCLAMGILGRNKGLAPFQLVFDFQDKRKIERNIKRSNAHLKVTAELESTSSWFPRPNKVMRSFYQKAMEEQYAGLGPEFVAVAVELSLILLDCPPKAAIRWLQQRLEQQSIDVNQYLSGRLQDEEEKSPDDNPERPFRATPDELQALYRASYTSMIISINYFGIEFQDATTNARRPDLSCFALLWLAEGHDAPEWWKSQWVRNRLAAESVCLKGNWKRAASWLLGLADIPSMLDLTRWPKWEI